MERVPVPAVIRYAALSCDDGLAIELLNYRKARELIANGDRERVERALAWAKGRPREIEACRRQWAALPCAEPDMPLDLLESWELGLAWLPHQIRAAQRALAE